MAERAPAEVAEFPCVHPVETAADKLSALSWRARSRDRSRANDDPTIIRHLHDLAADPPSISPLQTNRHAIAMHRLVRFFLSDVNIALNARHRLIGNQKRVPVAMNV